MSEEFDTEREESEELFEHYNFTADAGQTQLRIDKFLMDRIANATRNKIQNAIKQGYIFVNEKSVKANYKVRPNDNIVISLPNPPRDEELVAEDIPLNIQYEDDDVLLVNKPAGMVVHPAYQNWSGTLVNGLVHHFQNLPTSQNGEARPGLVHRIDKDTSGLLVIAKSEAAMNGLAKQFYDHSIERTYYALVWGDVKEDSGTIDAYIGRSLKDRKVMTVFPDGEYGKHAITHYKVLRRFSFVTLIQCNLETGRTHQIRAHLKYLGHPLFNDATYGGDRILSGNVYTKYKQFVQNCFKILPRQALHAKTLGFVHPITKKEVQFDTELPDDFKELLEKWGKYVEVMDL